MKKSLRFCLIMIIALLMAGCQEKFEPTESTIYITSKGAIQSALMESFDKDYYDFEEFSEDVKKEVKSYCLDVNEEVITIESLTQENDMVTLMMNYQTAEDYAAFNEVLLFTGTYDEAAVAGYVPEELYDTKGQMIDMNSEKLGSLKVVVTEEDFCIQTSGKIKYVSNNVSIIDKKMAKSMEAGKHHLAFVVYK